MLSPLRDQDHRTRAPFRIKLGTPMVLTLDYIFYHEFSLAVSDLGNAMSFSSNEPSSETTNLLGAVGRLDQPFRLLP